MPYKHIAAHLNKTELACRLHYHQISHGSNRRKRNLSCSSTMSDYSQHFRGRSMSREPRLSPVSQFGSAAPSPSTSPSRTVRLPSIVDATAPSNLAAILPKPNNGVPQPQQQQPQQQQQPPQVPRQSIEVSATARYPEGQRMLPVLEHKQGLKLDTALPSVSAAPSHNSSHVDLARLHQIYSAHRNTFWAAIASEYGHNAAPSTLEQAWKSGRCCGQQNQSPITPSASPCSDSREGFSYEKGSQGHRGSISSILGPDASMRSAWDRDMIRKMEIN